MANISFNTSLLNESNNEDPFQAEDYTMHVVTCIIIAVSLPLVLVAIYALYSLVRNDHVAPIYIINLLISDLMQLCCMIVWESDLQEERINDIVKSFYDCGLMASVHFMVCISLERYLVIAHPLWYRFKRTIRISVAVCVVVWLIPIVLTCTVNLWETIFNPFLVFAMILIIPFPLFIFFLVGTLRALSTSVSVHSDEKQRIVAILVLVLLIYTLLFLPSVILHIAENNDETLYNLSFTLVKLSPLADLLLYVFIRKGTVGKLLTCVCCCKKENYDISNNINTTHLDDI
ncbi:ovarian cancer G-protein coupled receptor 1-like [Cheilinus undulatus]|uniref:ovarian cancer G-protein coupled receptor 1-like n=1 Tax=Cheilinus undulatus TaxID=241271 RepID=UPI001BD1C566|nr:ovarian cancer G-protein coupled receptor 1-like [Cheilinus undulatus]